MSDTKSKSAYVLTIRRIPRPVAGRAVGVYLCGQSDSQPRFAGEFTPTLVGQGADLQ